MNKEPALDSAKICGCKPDSTASGGDSSVSPVVPDEVEARLKRAPVPTEFARALTHHAPQSLTKTVAQQAAISSEVSNYLTDSPIRERRFLPPVYWRPLPGPLSSKRQERQTRVQSESRPVEQEQATSWVRSKVGLDHSFDILVYPGLLTADQLITDSNGNRLVRTPEPSWLLFVDHEPGAFWSHPAEVCLIGRQSGLVRAFSTDDYPLFDGVEEVFSRDNDEDAIVFSHRRQPPVVPSLAITQDLFNASPETIGSTADAMMPYLLDGDQRICPGRVTEPGPCHDPHAYDEGYEDTYYCADTKPAKRYALLIQGPPKDRGKWGADLDDVDINNAIKHFAIELGVKGRGFDTFKLILPRRKKGQDLDKYRKKVNKALKSVLKKFAKLVTCRDELFIFYAGHGQRINQSKDGNNKDGPFEYRLAQSITAEWLRDQLKPIRTCHLHMVIDCCYSGGFIDVLNTLPGLETLYTSAAKDETAKVSRWDEGTRYAEREAEYGGEFASGFIKHLRQNRPNKVYDIEQGKDVWINKPDNVRQLLEETYRTALANDSAKKAGLTHPQRYVRVKRCLCGDEGARYISLLDCPNQGWTVSALDTPARILKKSDCYGSCRWQQDPLIQHWPSRLARG